MAAKIKLCKVQTQNFQTLALKVKSTCSDMKRFR